MQQPQQPGKILRWVKAQERRPITQIDVFIRYGDASCQEKETGNRDTMLDLEQNGWLNVEWLEETEDLSAPASPVEEIGQKLKLMREKEGLTPKDILDKTGISLVYLDRLENGELKSRSASVLYKLSELYKIDPKPLLVEAGVIVKKSAESKPSPVIEMDISEANRLRRLDVQRDGYDDFCEAHQIPYNDECSECSDIKPPAIESGAVIELLCHTLEELGKMYGDEWTDYVTDQVHSVLADAKSWQDGANKIPPVIEIGEKDAFVAYLLLMLNHRSTAARRVADKFKYWEGAADAFDHVKNYLNNDGGHPAPALIVWEMADLIALYKASIGLSDAPQEQALPAEMLEWMKAQIPSILNEEDAHNYPEDVAYRMGIAMYYKMQAEKEKLTWEMVALTERLSTAKEEAGEAEELAADRLSVINFQANQIAELKSQVTMWRTQLENFKNPFTDSGTF